MRNEFPAVPEIPVTGMDQALEYYQHKLGFDVDWGRADAGITSQRTTPDPGPGSTRKHQFLRQIGAYFQLTTWTK